MFKTGHTGSTHVKADTQTYTQYASLFLRCEFLCLIQRDNFMDTWSDIYVVTNFSCMEIMCIWLANFIRDLPSISFLWIQRKVIFANNKVTTKPQKYHKNKDVNRTQHGQKWSLETRCTCNGQSTWFKK